MFLLVSSRGTSEAPHRRRINRKQGHTMITIRRNHTTSMGSHSGDQATDRNRRRVLATAFVLITAIASIPSMATAVADGALDTTFDTDGKVTTAVAVGDEGKAIAIQSNGKILVVGNDMADFEVVRYNTDGSLDTTFDTDGKVTTDIGTSTTDSANAVAIQSDGKIVVAGRSGGMALNSGNFAVVRYNTDGSLDTTFDTDGKQTTDIGTSTPDSANAVAIQSDGKIVATGSSGSSTDFAVVRYTTTGTLDTTFDTDGKQTTDIGTSTSDTGSAVAIQSDSKIVVAGTSSNDFAVVRYTTTGTLDTTFDTDGKQTTDIGTSTSDTGSAVAIQSDSKIVVAGRISVSGPPVFAVARYEVTATSPSSSSTSSTSTTVAVATATSPTTTAVVSGTSTATGNMSSTTLPETGSSSPMPGIIGAILVAVGLALEARRRLTPIP